MPPRLGSLHQLKCVQLAEHRHGCCKYLKFIQSFNSHCPFFPELYYDRNPLSLVAVGWNSLVDSEPQVILAAHSELVLSWRLGES